MVESTPKRELVVVLHADVVGSTALVRTDEALAHASMLDAFQRLSQSIESYGGVTRELRGDALIGEFRRASDAVCAALSFQAKNVERNDTLTHGLKPQLRIGVAMGEVIVDDRIITGLGVVLAQRLEQLAEPNAVCLHGAVVETLPERLPFDYRDRGSKVLKGFESPVQVYEVARRGDAVLPEPDHRPPTIDAFRVVANKTPPPVDGATIAVLPFATLDGDPDRAYLGQGIAADIHTDLTRFRDLFVSGRSSCMKLAESTTDGAEIARTLGVEYLVRGSVRSAGDRFRIAAELIDGESGRVLWSERYDRVSEDILSIESEVAASIAGTLALQVKDVLHERSRHLSPDELSAYHWLLRGNHNLERGGPENLSRAKTEFGKALELNPQSAAACAGLSVVHSYEIGELYSVDHAASLEQHRVLAEQALELDESDSRGHYAMACVYQFYGHFELADQHAVRALELNPSEYHNICTRGYTLLALDRVEECAASFSESLRRNPLSPNSCLLALGLAEYRQRNYGQSAITLARMTPSYLQRLSSMAATYAQLGYHEKAREAGSEFWRLAKTRPGYPGADADWRPYWKLLYPWGDEADFEALLEGLARAGLTV